MNLRWKFLQMYFHFTLAGIGIQGGVDALDISLQSGDVGKIHKHFCPAASCDVGNELGGCFDPQQQ